MATPSGQIGFSDVNLELGVSPTSTQANMGSAPFRTLAGVPSGQISMSNLQNKSFLSGSGGNVDGLIPGNGYAYHTFTGPGTFTLTSSVSAEILIVGGGGAGGSDGGGGGTGGGGAGGLLYGTLSLTTGSYPIVVGATSADAEGTNGNPSSAFGATANGGGAGGYAGSVAAKQGGSGGGGSAGSPGLGGAAANQSPAVLPFGTLTGYGNNGGGGGSGSPRAGGGGGGAGGVGGTGSPAGGGPSAGGVGRQYTQFEGTLIGLPSLAPLNGFFAGGGAGALGTPSTGGSGGGGNGGPTGTDGLTNSGGGGGGGAAYPNPGSAGGTGGSGIVVIRYPI